jgi:hypothetical protein
VARDDFAAPVRNSLRMRAALICSNPDCRKQTAAPASMDDDSFVCIGKASHITAAAVGGPRYDPTLTPQQRSSISNAIFLCSGCADVIDKNNGREFPTPLLRQWKAQHEIWIASNLNKGATGTGGDGGDGTIVGNRGVVIGGRGGSGGIGGNGGKGGGGLIQGDDGLIIGGDGGNCSTADGRGGAGAKGPTERLGVSTALWGFGRGGSAPNHPEYDRRIQLLTMFRQEHKAKFPHDSVYIDAGIDPVPADWINQRLAECNEPWRVTMGKHGYVLPPLN